MMEEQCIHGENAMIHIDAKVRVIFMNNAADSFGGAVYVINGMITVGAESHVEFTHLCACL